MSALKCARSTATWMLTAPTMFDLVPSSIAALNVINRGLDKHNRIGYGLRFIARTTKTHFREKLVDGWTSTDTLPGRSLNKFA